MSIEDVSNVLWRERELLELLLFKLEEEQLLIATGRTKWLPHATREVEVIIDQIRSAETVRATKVDALAGQLGLAPEPSLKQLIDAVPAEWKEVFTNHRQEFHTLTHQIHEVAKNNRDSLSASQQAVEETLDSLDDALVTTYDPKGRASSRANDHTRTFLVDEAL